MTDLRKTIEPKTDQQNFDSFTPGESKTITITDVKLTAGDQPIAIHFAGDEGKPWKPCKSMRRVLVMVWGTDGAAFKGRQLTLYGDPNVMFGGVKVGGIRISHMSHIDQPVALPLTVTRAKKVAFTVQPLVDTLAPLRKFGEDAAKSGLESLKMWWAGIGGAKQQLLGAAYLDELKKIAEGVKEND